MIYLFNPDTDLALSEPGHNYLPPAPIRRMRQDLAMLPAWYAEAGSTVWGCSEADVRHLRWLQEMFHLDVTLAGDALFQRVSSVDDPLSSAVGKHGIVPWGWNKSLRRSLSLRGIDDSLLPSVELLDRRRETCSRRCTAGILRHFQEMKLERVGGEAKEVVAISDERLVMSDERLAISDERLVISNDTHHSSLTTHHFVLKSLWSSSGKGLYWCRRGLSPDALDWARRTLKRDGALMLEPIYNKVSDFAMEFYADARGRVTFVGYSLFLTNARGAYQGNLLATDEEIEAWLAQYIPLDTLLTVRRTLCQQLEALINPSIVPSDGSPVSSPTPLYTGYLGVDMMLYRPGQSAPVEGQPLCLHPCVEVNFRMNMGVVAHTFVRRFLANDCPGRYSRFLVESYPTPEALRLQHEKDLRTHPLSVTKSRLSIGYLPLTPITETATYRVCVIVE